MIAAACERHGLLFTPTADEGCPRCGGEVLDLASEDDHFYLASRAELAATRRGRFGLLFAFLAMMIGPSILEASFDLPEHPILSLLSIGVWVAAYGFVRLVGFVLRSPARIRLDWRVTAEARAARWRTVGRILTGTPVIVATLLVAIHVILDEPILKLIFSVSRGMLDGPQDAWRLVSANLLHKSDDHLIGNLVGLLWLGSWLDLRVGRWRTAVTLLLGGISGAVLHVLLSEAPVVGASGAVFALYGALLVVMPRVPLSLSPHGLALPAFLHAGAFAVGQLIVDVFGGAAVSWQGHLGGFVVGMLLGFMLRTAPESPRWTAIEAARSRG